MNRRKVAALGFTLIELMIAVLIISILSAIAVPSYRNYILRSRRTDATTALMRLQAAEEKYYLQYNTYTANLTDGAPDGLGIGTGTENSYYTLAVALQPLGVGYTATATPSATGRQSDDGKCTTFTITHTGQKGATGSASNPRETCWQ